MLYRVAAVCSLLFPCLPVVGATNLPFGQVTTGSVTASSGVALPTKFSFSGNTGDLMNFLVVATSGSLVPEIQLYNSSGTVIASNYAGNPFGCGGTQVGMNTIQLPATETYGVWVTDCNGVNGGSFSIYLQRTNNPGGTLLSVPFGSEETGAISGATDTDTYTFTANANDEIDLTLNTTSGAMVPAMRIYNPNGTPLTSNFAGNPFGCGGTDVQLNTVQIPTTGTYTLLVNDCNNVNNGDYEIYAQRTNAPGGTVVALMLDQVQTGSIDTETQNNTYTLAANANDVFNIIVDTTSGALIPMMRLYNPGGALVASNFAGNPYGCGGSEVSLNGVTAATTGTYILLVSDCDTTNSGDYSMFAQRVSNPTGTVTLPIGQTVTGLVGEPLVSEAYTLNGNQGDVFDFTLVTTNGSLVPASALYTSAGAVLASNYSGNPFGCGGGGLEMNTITLPSTGTYYLYVYDCDTTNTGNYALYTQRINNPTGASPVLWGQVQTGTVGATAQSTTYTFPGTSGNTIDLTVSGTTSGSKFVPKVRLYNPNGSLLTSNYSGNPFGCGGTSVSLNSVSLSQNGTYTLLVGDCSDTNTGNISLVSQCFGTCPVPAPVIASISPLKTLAPGSGFTLRVNGSNFVNQYSTSVVQWAGSDLSTTFVSTGQITAQVPAADVATAGVFPVTVYTPGPGGGTSNAVDFTVNNPVPTVSSISPTNVAEQGPDFTLTVNGTNFVRGSSVQWNGYSLATTFVSGQELQATVPASDILSAGSATVTVFNAAPGGGTSAPGLTFTITRITPKITWATPAAITYGTALGPNQLNATASVAGTFAYTPTAGTVLTAGSQTLAATFTPTDSTDYLTAMDSVTLTVNQAAPIITWPPPAPITYGTLVSATQEDATANVAGTFSYNEPVGWKPKAGTRSITVTFTPTDATNYKTVKATVTLIVNQVTPTVTWPTPSAVAYGTALSGTQLDATASVAGSFVYTPASGTVPAAGAQTLSVTFTPTDATDYAAVTTTVTLLVNKDVLTVRAVSASRAYGVANPTLTDTFTGFVNGDTQSVVSGAAALSTTATSASTVGSFPITAAQGTLSAANYTFGFVNGTLTVTQATPMITWPKPAAITYGTALSATQLNATSKTAGTFAYNPGAGAVLTAGTQTLSVSFTPTDTVDYTTATASVALTVNKAAPEIPWPNPAPIVYGTLVSAAQEDATANVPGTFSYSQPMGWKPKAGTHTISVTFAPTDSTDYKTAVATVTLTVNQAMPLITWPAPASIGYGTALSSTQLDATVSVPAVCTYTPAAGTLLSLGKQTLGVSCVPTDSTDYSTATASVMLTVTRGTPVIAWATPAPITYGTPVSAIQENATADVAGTFTYSQQIGWKPTAGTHSLAAYFTPSDTTDYVKVTTTVTLTVVQATPTVKWTTPTAITYGTALAAQQLDATANVPGVFSYAPARGTVLTAGAQTLAVTFAPTDTNDYAAASASVTLMVNQAKPVIVWATPAPILYGTAVSATQEDAAANVPGTFAYSQPIGWKPIAGTHTLSVRFTPDDTMNNKMVTASVTLTVNAAP
ncbi:MAG TPA: MBG domain-containing protein [Acidobacteriaceae bacterium]|nr:MBG domain-containing protein [Acidobacteriaceae bacterium]